MLPLAVYLAGTSYATVRYAVDSSLEVPADYLGICPTIALDSRELALTESAGAAWIRQDFAWDTIETRAGVWDFRHWDGYVDRAGLAQRHILAILDYDVRAP